MLNDNKTIKLVVLIISLISIYAGGYFIFTQTATGQPIAGVIPEVIFYIVPGYFMSSILIELLAGENEKSHIKCAMIKAAVLLGFFLVFALFYILFYQYVILAFDLEQTLLGQYSDLIFLIPIIFLGIKIAQKFEKKIGIFRIF